MTPVAADAWLRHLRRGVFAADRSTASKSRNQASRSSGPSASARPERSSCVPLLASASRRACGPGNPASSIQVASAPEVACAPSARRARRRRSSRVCTRGSNPSSIAMPSRAADGVVDPRSPACAQAHRLGGERRARVDRSELRVERADRGRPLIAVGGVTRAHQRLRKRAERAGLRGRLRFPDALRQRDFARGDERRVPCERFGDEAPHARAIVGAMGQSRARERALRWIGDCGGHPRRAIASPDRDESLDHVAGVEVGPQRDERVVRGEELRRTGCAEGRRQYLRRAGRQDVVVVGRERRALGQRARAGFVECERHGQVFGAHDADRSKISGRPRDRVVRVAFDVERRGRGEEERAAETGPVDAHVREHALQCCEQAAQQVFVDEAEADPLHEDAVGFEAVACQQRRTRACRDARRRRPRDATAARRSRRSVLSESSSALRASLTRTRRRGSASGSRSRHAAKRWFARSTSGSSSTTSIDSTLAGTRSSASPPPSPTTNMLRRPGSRRRGQGRQPLRHQLAAGPRVLRVDAGFGQSVGAQLEAPLASQHEHGRGAPDREVRHRAVRRPARERRMAQQAPRLLRRQPDESERARERDAGERPAAHDPQRRGRGEREVQLHTAVSVPA